MIVDLLGNLERTTGYSVLQIDSFALLGSTGVSLKMLNLLSYSKKESYMTCS